MSLVRWSPFRELEDMFPMYRGLLGNALRSGEGADATNGDLSWRPTADISENDKEYIVRAELPDVKREDVNVSIDGGVLRIEGERRYEKTTEDEKQHRTESMYGTFFRAFNLPDNVDADHIEAKSKHGVLTIHIPKSEKESKKAIEIKVK